MTTQNTSICPPPLPPSPPSSLLLLLHPTPQQRPRSHHHNLLSSIWGHFWSIPSASSRLRCRLSLPSLASEVPSAAHGFPSCPQSSHPIRMRFRPSPLPLPRFQLYRPPFDDHLLVQGLAFQLELQERHSIPLHFRRRTTNPFLPRQSCVGRF